MNWPIAQNPVFCVNQAKINFKSGALNSYVAMAGNANIPSPSLVFIHSV